MCDARDPPSTRIVLNISLQSKMAVAANEEELQFILSLDDTDVDKDDQASPSIRQSTNSFTVNELISVLERISSSMIKPEVALAKAILLNTHGKELFTALNCFVSAFC